MSEKKKKYNNSNNINNRQFMWKPQHIQFVDLILAAIYIELYIVSNQMFKHKLQIIFTPKIFGFHVIFSSCILHDSHSKKIILIILSTLTGVIFGLGNRLFWCLNSTKFEHDFVFHLVYLQHTQTYIKWPGLPVRLDRFKTKSLNILCNLCISCGHILNYHES